MKIYKYYNWNIPRCTNVSRGYYKKDTEEIGFGSDDTIPDNNAIELTEVEYYTYITSIGGNVTDAENLLIKLSGLSAKSFQGRIVVTKEEVLKISRDASNQLFSDPENNLSNTEYQIKLISQMLVILFANSGLIKYEDTGIAGVLDKNSADVYVLSLLPAWLKANQIVKDAEQFILENKL